eukprot:SAG31_NODE_41385_length_276_cov_0.853107_1_plen_45_part_01
MKPRLSASSLFALAVAIGLMVSGEAANVGANAGPAPHPSCGRAAP